MTENIGKLIDIEANNGERFQKQLAKFAMGNGFKKIVETGAGVSSVFMLYEMMHTVNMEDAMLYSIDPSKWYPHEIVSPQHELILAKSIPALKDLYLRIGAFDLLLTDGNHEIFCQTYEYEFGYNCLRVGGVLIADDVSWNNNGAWDNFLKRYSLQDMQMGDTRYVIKSGSVLGYPFGVEGIVFSKEAVESFHSQTLSFAKSEEKIFLDNGGVYADCFKD